MEYVSIEAAVDLTAPISLARWSLQSARTGIRIPLPQGTRVFVMGAVPRLEPVQLDPGGRAIITTGASPVGVSFRENSCSGYLDQFQSFVPSLDTYSCASPADEMPDTLESAQLYGDTCAPFARSLPRCTFSTTPFPSDVSNSCRSFIQHVLSYNGCVEHHKWRPSFPSKDWRLFLGKPWEAWAATRDVIRLLDESGRTVDVWSY